MKKKTIGKLLIAAGMVMVFAAAGIYAGYDNIDKQAGEYAEELVAALDDAAAEAAESGAAEQISAAAGEMPQRTLAGYPLIGEIVVPSVGIDLPVLNDWSYDLLKISPCRYSGSVEDGNFIILGHNYKSHFTPLKNVQAGEAVYFTDVNGRTYAYTVAAVETLHKTQLDDLTMNDYDMSLFTCTTGGQYRFVARCMRVE